MNSRPYRQGVYALVINKDANAIFMVHKRNSNVWDFPGGGIDSSESMEQALKRELTEELGTKNFKILHKSANTYKYDWPNSEIEKNHKKTGKLMRGQEQHFFIISYLGNDGEIALQEEELVDFKWIPFTDIESCMVYPDLYGHIVEIFKEYGVNI